MGTTNTSLSVVNFSGMPIESTYVTVSNLLDWDQDSSPHGHMNRAIKVDEANCQHVEIRNASDHAKFTMTFQFVNPTTQASVGSLTLEADQVDALTKYSREVKSELTWTGATPAPQLVVFQVSGGQSNAFYIRTKTAPNMSQWMVGLDQRITLKNLVMPGSHDAGLYMTSSCTGGGSPTNTTTQGLDIAGQLWAGSRYFDFRVYHDGTDYRLAHYGTLGGCYGPKLDDVLGQVRAFIEGPGSGEVVFLKFSHTGTDGEIHFNPFSSPPSIEVMVKTIVQKVGAGLANQLYKPTSASNLYDTPLSTLKGKVVALFADEFTLLYSSTSGILPFGAVSETGNTFLCPPNATQIYDSFSEKQDLGKMQTDQLTKLENYGQARQSWLFLLSWTLTGGPGLTDVQVLSSRANPWLVPQLGNWSYPIPGIARTNSVPNIVYLDFIDPWLGQAIVKRNYGYASRP